MIDLETTGLPLKEKKQFRTIYNYDHIHIVSIAWIVIDEETHMEHGRKYYVVKPADYEIPASSVAIHGISQEEATRTGVDLATVVSELQKALKTYDCQVLVAHNLQFDLNVLCSVLYRAHQAQLCRQIRSMRRYCTMNEGRKLLQCRTGPKLTVLYTHFTQTPIENAHNALGDALSCLECYRKLRKLQKPQPHTARLK